METSLTNVVQGMDTMWVILAAALVFFMEAGFAALEAGFVSSKNALNIVMKVFTDCTVGMLAYWAIGFAIMFGISKGGFYGTDGFFLKGAFSHLNLNVSVYAYWLFQAAFAVAVATIVSGAVAERMKFGPYIVFSAVATAIIYPVAAHWVWNPDGWLAKMGMLDFAGSAAVHAVGGWGSLAAIMVLGPRTGKYGKDGSIHPIPGHNLPLAALGAFFLWFGWFGFNAGSTLSAMHPATSLVAITTNLAAAAGGVAGTIFTNIKYGRPDPSMALNGALAGLVAVTGGAAYVSPIGAVIIGLIAGVLVVIAVEKIDALHFDDPVGAVAVHGVCGTFGALAVGLFSVTDGLFYGHGSQLLITQSIGILAVSAWSFVTTFGVFTLMKKTVGIRVSEQEESEGLDLCEHGIAAYTSGEYVAPINPWHDVFTPAVSIEKKQ